MDARLSKSERISSVKAIDVLVAKGRYVSSGPLRCCFMQASPGEDGVMPCSRMMVSVPKRFFKRAVKRNLLKRRIREAYRLQKGLLSFDGVQMMFVYSSKEVADFQQIFASLQEIVNQINERLAAKQSK